MRQTKNKHFRIVNYLANNFERVRWNPDIDSRYMKHILKYNELTSVKDPADSAASLVRLLLRHPGKKGGDDPGGGGSPGPGPRKPESGKVRTAGSVRRNIRRYGGGRGSRW